MQVRDRTQDRAGVLAAPHMLSGFRVRGEKINTALPWVKFGRQDARTDQYYCFKLCNVILGGFIEI